jgi:putative FmdB family regulatory protein
VHGACTDLASEEEYAMPTYELHCQKCDKTFDVQEPLKVYEDQKRTHSLHCPQCQSTELEPQLGTVEVKTSRKS